MAVIRINKNENYTVMSNHHLREKEMSLKAKGLLSLMLSLPKDWDYSINGLVAISKENETSINSALKELKEFGYLKVTKVLPCKANNGKFNYIYDIFEKPIKKSQALENQEVEIQGVENLGVEIQALENQGQLNTNNKIKNNKIKNNNIICSNAKKEMFESFWNEYPKKVNKKNAEKSFMKIKNLDDELFKKIITKLEEHKKIWKDKQFIPYPSTWLNGERWNDELEILEKKDSIDRMNDIFAQRKSKR